MKTEDEGGFKPFVERIGSLQRTQWRPFCVSLVRSWIRLKVINHGSYEKLPIVRFTYATSPEAFSYQERDGTVKQAYWKRGSVDRRRYGPEFTHRFIYL